MRVVILAGGTGTRMGIPPGGPPKPLTSIAGQPIIAHVMDIFAIQGLDDFLVCAGHRGEELRRYFERSGRRQAAVVDTGQQTLTGGRLLRIAPLLGARPFFLAYADCLADVDLQALLARHRELGALVTLTAVHPPQPFGVIDFAADGSTVVAFREKPNDLRYVNGGFMVVEPEALGEIEGDATSWEHGPLARLAAGGRLAAYRHEGFWHSMNTSGDRAALEALCSGGAPPWMHRMEERACASW